MRKVEGNMGVGGREEEEETKDGRKEGRKEGRNEDGRKEEW